MLLKKCVQFSRQPVSVKNATTDWPVYSCCVVTAANIHDKYRRCFVLANTSQQTKTLLGKAHVRCIMHDIGITSSFVW